MEEADRVEVISVKGRASGRRENGLCEVEESGDDEGKDLAVKAGGG